jgi:hypothetical protein
MLLCREVTRWANRDQGGVGVNRGKANVQPKAIIY